MSGLEMPEAMGLLIAKRFCEPPSVCGKVYYIACPETERLKIGFTNGTPEARLKGLQTGSPTELRLLAHHPGFIEDERYIHEHYADARLHGEWFQMNERLFAHMAYVCWTAAVNARWRKVEAPEWAQIGLAALEENYGSFPTDLGGRIQ